MFMAVEMDLGTDIKEAAEKAHTLGNKLDVHIQFKFNGVSCTIYNNRECFEEFEESFLKALKLPVEESLKWAHN